MSARRRLARAASPYTTDPPSAASSGRPVLMGSVFDGDRYLKAMRAGLIDGIPQLDHPTDALLVSTVTALGCPRFAAEQMRFNPALRLAFYGLWLANREAARGDHEAREIVDVARAAWDEMRRSGTIADSPIGGVGLDGR